METILKFIQGLFRMLGFSRPEPEPDPFPTFYQNLIHSIGQTREEELSCDEVFALLDQYAEKVQAAEEAELLMPLVKHHLDMCPDCREEFEGLIRTLSQVSS